MGDDKHKDRCCWGETLQQKRIRLAKQRAAWLASLRKGPPGRRNV